MGPPKVTRFTALWLCLAFVVDCHGRKINWLQMNDSDFRMWKFELPKDCGRSFKPRSVQPISRSPRWNDDEYENDEGRRPPRHPARLHRNQRAGSRRAKSIRKQTPRIIGGSYVSREEYPSVVQVISIKDELRMQYDCAGTLIHPQVVLTAIHCISQKTDPWVVADDKFLHKLTRYPSNKFIVRHKVAYYCVPQWYLREEVVFNATDEEFDAIPYDDIAMLVLREPIPIDRKHWPACINRKTLPPDGEAILAGYGVISDTEYADRMKTLKVRRIPCRDNPQPNSTCWRSASPDGQGSWCTGDNGAPLFTIRNGRQYIGATAGEWAYKQGICKADSEDGKIGIARDTSYYYHKYIKNWLAADENAYKTQCFEAPYKRPDIVESD